MTDTHTSSPGPRSSMREMPQAARLRASLALRTNTTSPGSVAPTKRAARARTPSTASVAATERP